jgi:hypothetical protein
MNLQCSFDLKHIELQEMAWSLPPGWTYGTLTSLRETFASLPALSPERSKFADCVASWMNGMLEKERKFKQRQMHSLLWKFHHAKQAVERLQKDQQEVLKELNTFVNRVFTFNKRLQLANSMGGNWIDTTMVDKGSRKKDYREVWVIDEVELDDNFFIEYFPDDDDDDDDEYGSDSEDRVLGGETEVDNENSRN